MWIARGGGAAGSAERCAVSPPQVFCRGSSWVATLGIARVVVADAAVQVVARDAQAVGPELLVERAPVS